MGDAGAQRSDGVKQSDTAPPPDHGARHPNEHSVAHPTAARPSRLLQRAVALLARRDYGRLELQRRLQRLLSPGEDPAQIAHVLDLLQAQGLLCDERFAAGLTRQRAARFGATRVGHDLRQRGLPESLVRSAVAPLRATELARAQALWQKRFGVAPQSRADYARQARFLAGRGFPGDVIRQAIGCRCETDHDDRSPDDSI